MTRFIFILAIIFLPTTALVQTLDSSSGPIAVETRADGLRTPWALAFLPDGQFLVTEREGDLWLFDGRGNRTRVRGLPNIHVRGQGGLMDVMIPRDFARSREVFLSYSRKQSRGTGTAVARAILAPGSNRLKGLRVIFEMTPGSKGGRHYGSRIVEARDGTLFITLGERGDRESAQDLSRHNGSVVRINRDGSVPGDNPFRAQSGAQPEIWSYGHRNPQGAALDRFGTLWVVEHGARGGDEVNVIRRGANYGWPVIAYGRHYTGMKIGEGHAKPGMKQPEHYWDPSIAPSGMMIYSGKLWPKWRGHMFVGSLKFDMISRLSGANLREVERIEGDVTKRVRDIREAPDGAIWFIAEDIGSVLRLTPAN